MTKPKPPPVIAVDKAEQEAIKEIWGYVRDHQGSLDSERARVMIESLVDGALEVARREIERLLKQAKTLRDKASQERKRAKALEAEIARLDALAVAGTDAKQDERPNGDANEPEADMAERGEDRGDRSDGGLCERQDPVRADH